MNAAIESMTPVWIESLQKLINKALAMDEETLEALAELEGKLIAFEFINTQLIVYLFPCAQGLKIETVCSDKPDVSINGSPANFIMMLAASKQANGLPTDMQISGDIGLAQHFQKIMQGVEIDLEEPLSKWVGDSVAHQIGRFVRGSGRFAMRTGKILARDVSEYLRFEVNMLPDDLLLDEFSQDVDQLRNDVDRFAQRLNKLEQRINNKQQED